jgi:poly(beta-D-mannuronate) lyase
MNRILLLLIFFLIPNLSFGSDFKNIKKKATGKNQKIIFPIKKNKVSCSNKLLFDPSAYKINPIETLDAPTGYGLDDRFDIVSRQFEKFSIPCSSGNKKSCVKVKEVLLKWATADSPKRTKQGDLWNDTLTINLHINNPMISSYSFASQIIDFSKKEEKTIEDWFKKSVKRGKHLMYDSSYKDGTQARGTPRRAHNHALSSAISHMQLGIILNDNKLFKLAFKNYEAALRYQRKDGSLPIEVRRGGRAMFYQARAMTALTSIAIIAENQGYNIWDYEHKGKNFHNIVKFFIDLPVKVSVINLCI